MATMLPVELIVMAMVMMMMMMVVMMVMIASTHHSWWSCPWYPLICVAVVVIVVAAAAVLERIACCSLECESVLLLLLHLLLLLSSLLSFVFLLRENPHWRRSGSHDRDCLCVCVCFWRARNTPSRLGKGTTFSDALVNVHVFVCAFLLWFCLLPPSHAATTVSFSFLHVRRRLPPTPFVLRRCGVLWRASRVICRVIWNFVSVIIDDYVVFNGLFNPISPSGDIYLIGCTVEFA